MTPEAREEAVNWQAIARARAAALLRRARLLEAMGEWELAGLIRAAAVRLQGGGVATEAVLRRHEIRRLRERAAILDREGYFDLAESLRAEADRWVRKLRQS